MFFSGGNKLEKTIELNRFKKVRTRTFHAKLNDYERRDFGQVIRSMVWRHGRGSVWAVGDVHCAGVSSMEHDQVTSVAASLTKEPITFEEVRSARAMPRECRTVSWQKPGHYSDYSERAKLTIRKP